MTRLRGNARLKKLEFTVVGHVITHHNELEGLEFGFIFKVIIIVLSPSLGGGFTKKSEPL